MSVTERASSTCDGSCTRQGSTCDACRARAYRARKKAGEVVPREERKRLALLKELNVAEREAYYHRRQAEDHRVAQGRAEATAENLRNALGQLRLALSKHET